MSDIPRTDAANKQEWKDSDTLKRELDEAITRRNEAERIRSERGAQITFLEFECDTLRAELASALRREQDQIVLRKTILAQLAAAQSERDAAVAARDEALEQAKQSRISRHAQEELTKKAFAKWKVEQKEGDALCATTTESQESQVSASNEEQSSDPTALTPTVSTTESMNGVVRCGCATL